MGALALSAMVEVFLKVRALSFFLFFFSREE